MLMSKEIFIQPSDRSVPIALIFVMAGLLFLLAWPADSASAVTTLNVTKIADTNDGACDADCSPREAIAAASAGDTIEIPAGNYTLTSGAELFIEVDLTLNGAGATTTRIQASTLPGVASARVLNITGGDVAMSDLTIRHGNTTGQGGGILTPVR